MRVLVCEDGSEYTERFTRFLGAEHRFQRAGHFAEALRFAAASDALLLDLDFRRTPKSLLVDERGGASPGVAAEVQGILILRALRARGVLLPALLFADLDDEDHAARLEADLAPLRVVPGSVGLIGIAQLLREVVRSAAGSDEKS